MCRSSALIYHRVGEENIKGIFLCGSFARGEGSLAEVGGCPAFLSDIDLVLVLNNPEAHRIYWARRTELGAACESLLPGATFIGHPEVGILLYRELSTLPAS
ncbi:MAG: hypothetical protein JXB45_11905, partial [Candidatus Krumholzibacteriota bacterium]|nr:hypothetical protein [Candidatus Krumholzibacteriota bacterium]